MGKRKSLGKSPETSFNKNIKSSPTAVSPNKMMKDKLQQTPKQQNNLVALTESGQKMEIKNANKKRKSLPAHLANGDDELPGKKIKIDPFGGTSNLFAELNKEETVPLKKNKTKLNKNKKAKDSLETSATSDSSIRETKRKEKIKRLRLASKTKFKQVTSEVATGSEAAITQIKAHVARLEQETSLTRSAKRRLKTLRKVLRDSGIIVSSPEQPSNTVSHNKKQKVSQLKQNNLAKSNLQIQKKDTSEKSVEKIVSQKAKNKNKKQKQQAKVTKTEKESSDDEENSNEDDAESLDGHEMIEDESKEDENDESDDENEESDDENEESDDGEESNDGEESDDDDVDNEGSNDSDEESDDDDNTELKTKKAVPNKTQFDRTKDADSPSKSRYVLFVGNLPYDVTNEDISEHFSKIGQVKHIRIPLEKQTNKPRGFAFVELLNQESYEKALSLHQTFVKGRQINVQYSQGGQKMGDEKNQQGKAKNFKLQAMRQQGKFGNAKQSQKRSFRRTKQQNSNRE